ncbi:MXAN_6521/LA_1396 family lipoprotein [Myxococcaceae bacterium JPH2]|nr:MXAN_6521/LA_1396 family lipoprotein [Myxococcaceae bacterium JPH2]
MMKRLGPVLGLLVLAGCASTVKSQRLRDDYAQVDRLQVKRLAVVTQPLPDDKAEVGELWSLIARQWVNQNRDFLVKSNVALPGQPADAAFREQCVEGIEGVLWLSPQVKRVGDGVEAAVKAQLLRCRDGQEVWAVESAGSWGSKDAKYVERTEQYVQQFGPSVEPYVVPSYKLLVATLETLPNPELTDADKDEKIDLGE